MEVHCQQRHLCATYPVGPAGSVEQNLRFGTFLRVPSGSGTRVALTGFMTDHFDNPFLSSKQPFLWSDEGWKIFLKIRQTTLGPLHTFQGAVIVESGQGRVCFEGLVEEVKCPRHHTTFMAAAYDAMDLSRVVLTVIRTTLDGDN